MDNSTKLLVETIKLVRFFGSADNAYEKVLRSKAPCHFKGGKKKLLKLLRMLKAFEMKGIIVV